MSIDREIRALLDGSLPSLVRDRRIDPERVYVRRFIQVDRAALSIRRHAPLNEAVAELVLVSHGLGGAPRHGSLRSPVMQTPDMEITTRRAVRTDQQHHGRHRCFYTAISTAPANNPAAVPP